MTRKLSVLFVLALFVMSLVGAVAIAANAKQAANGASSAAANSSAPKVRWDAIDEGSTDGFGKPSANSQAALGYEMLGITNVGFTEFDRQSNDRQQRQVAVGCNNNVHNVFIYRPFMGGDRLISYNTYVIGTSPGAPTDISPISGGYGAVSVEQVAGKAVAAWHYTPTSPAGARSQTQAGMQGSCAGTGFPNVDYPVPPASLPAIPNCSGIKTGVVGTQENGYIWPTVAGDKNTAGTQPLAHILSMEFSGAPTNDSSGIRSLIYYKSTDGVTGPSATCGTLIDSMASVNSEVVASLISDKVACVYTRPRVWHYGFGSPYGGGKNFGDGDNVVYKESSNLGASWGPLVQVSNYTDTTRLLISDGKSFSESAAEVSALYDANDCLHILWTTGMNDDSSHYYLIFPARLYHWSSCTSPCITMLKDANYGSGATCRPASGLLNISKATLSQCDSAGTKRLYAVYMLNPDYDESPDSIYGDCSTVSKKVNYEIFVQGSTDISGTMWGAPRNISNTRTNNCASGACNSESFTSASQYCTDSLRIQYLNDKDPGDFVAAAEGARTNNPVNNLSYPCYVVATQAILAAEPTSMVWPLHVVPNGTVGFDIALTNTGNATASVTPTYTGGAGATSIVFTPNPISVPAGCSNTANFHVQVNAGASQGIISFTIVLTWTNKATLTIPVEVYNFTNWYMEANQDIHTATARLAVNQNSRVGSQVTTHGFSFVSEAGRPDNFFDGSLLIGNSATKLSMALFADSAGFIGAGDPLIGRLFCLNTIQRDSLPMGAASPNGYRHVWGKGCNRDTSIGFDVDYYSSKWIDSCNFIVAKIALYSLTGSNINNVAVVYAADLDVPDANSNNTGGSDASRQLVYQQGVSAPTRFAGLAGVRGDAALLDGGHVSDNPRWIYPHRGYENDSVWTYRIQNAAGYTVFADSAEDLNSMLVFSKNTTIKPIADGPFVIYAIFVAQPATGGSLAGLQLAVDQAKVFISNYLGSGCNTCGDANGDDAIDISDAVYLIQYIFAGGPAPGTCGGYAFGKGDANGDCAVDISDAVYLIQYIFAGGPAPVCGIGCK